MKRNEHSIEVIFALVLFLVFASGVLMTLLYGANVYTGIQKQSSTAEDRKVSIPYIATKVRHYDESGSVSVAKFGEGDAVELDESIDGKPYVTYLYVYKGKLMELFMEKDAGLDPSGGQNITDTSALRADMSGGVLTVTCEYADGKSDSIKLYIRSGETTANET